MLNSKSFLRALVIFIATAPMLTYTHHASYQEILSTLTLNIPDKAEQDILVTQLCKKHLPMFLALADTLDQSYEEGKNGNVTFSPDLQKLLSTVHDKASQKKALEKLCESLGTATIKKYLPYLHAAKTTDDLIVFFFANFGYVAFEEVGKAYRVVEGATSMLSGQQEGISLRKQLEDAISKTGIKQEQLTAPAFNENGSTATFLPALRSEKNFSSLVAPIKDYHEILSSLTGITEKEVKTTNDQYIFLQALAKCIELLHTGADELDAAYNDGYNSKLTLSPDLQTFLEKIGQSADKEEIVKSTQLQNLGKTLGDAFAYRLIKVYTHEINITLTTPQEYCATLLINVTRDVFEEAKALCALRGTLHAAHNLPREEHFCKNTLTQKTDGLSALLGLIIMSYLAS